MKCLTKLFIYASIYTNSTGYIECLNLHVLSGPNKHTLTQIKDAVHDGLRAVKNALDDGAVIPGAGAFEIAVHSSLMEYKKSVKGRARLGIQVRDYCLFFIIGCMCKDIQLVHIYLHI